MHATSNGSIERTCARPFIDAGWEPVSVLITLATYRHRPRLVKLPDLLLPHPAAHHFLKRTGKLNTWQK